jgi:hypothetical protein
MHHQEELTLLKITSRLLYLIPIITYSSTSPAMLCCATQLFVRALDAVDLAAPRDLRGLVSVSCVICGAGDGSFSDGVL